MCCDSVGPAKPTRWEAGSTATYSQTPAEAKEDLVSPPAPDEEGRFGARRPLYVIRDFRTGRLLKTGNKVGDEVQIVSDHMDRQAFEDASYSTVRCHHAWAYEALVPGQSAALCAYRDFLWEEMQYKDSKAFRSRSYGKPFLALRLRNKKDLKGSTEHVLYGRIPLVVTDTSSPQEVFQWLQVKMAPVQPPEEARVLTGADIRAMSPAEMKKMFGGAHADTLMWLLKEEVTPESADQWLKEDPPGWRLHWTQKRKELRWYHWDETSSFKVLLAKIYNWSTGATRGGRSHATQMLAHSRLRPSEDGAGRDNQSGKTTSIQVHADDLGSPVDMKDGHKIEDSTSRPCNPLGSLVGTQGHSAGRRAAIVLPTNGPQVDRFLEHQVQEDDVALDFMLWSPKSFYPAWVRKDTIFSFIMAFSVLLSLVVLVLEPSKEAFDEVKIHAEERPFVKFSEQYVEKFFFVIFFIEFLVKATANGLFWSREPEKFVPYFIDKNNTLDFVSLAGSVVALLPTKGIAGGDIFLAFRILRLFRLLRYLTKYSSIKTVLVGLTSSLPNVLLVMLGTVYVVFVVSMMGVQSFSGRYGFCTDGSVQLRSNCIGDFAGDDGILRPRVWSSPDANFDSLGAGVLTLFETLSLSAWSRIMYGAMDATSRNEAPEQNANAINSVYFMIVIMLLSYFVVTIFIGVLLSSMDNESKVLYLTNLQKEWVVISGVLGRLRPKKGVENKGRLLPSQDNKRPILTTVLRMVTQLPQTCEIIIKQQHFRRMTAVIIWLNTVVLCCFRSSYTSEYEELTLKLANASFIVFFTAEAIIRWLPVPVKWVGEYIDSSDVKWKHICFDFILVATSLSYMGHFGTDSKIVIFVAKSFQLLKLLHILTLLNPSHSSIKEWWSTQKIFVETVGMALPSISFACVLLFLVIFVYAYLGVKFLGHLQFKETVNYEANYRDFVQAFGTLFQILTLDDWNLFMHDSLPGDGPGGCYTQPAPSTVPGIQCDYDEVGLGWCKHDTCVNRFMVHAFYMSFFGIGSFVFLNIVIAIIIDKFNWALNQKQLPIRSEHLKEFREVWMKQDPTGTGKVSERQLRRIVGDLYLLKNPVVYDQHEGDKHICPNPALRAVPKAKWNYLRLVFEVQRQWSNETKKFRKQESSLFDFNRVLMMLGLMKMGEAALMLRDHDQRKELIRKRDNSIAHELLEQFVWKYVVEGWPRNKSKVAQLMVHLPSWQDNATKLWHEARKKQEVHRKILLARLMKNCHIEHKKGQILQKMQECAKGGENRNWALLLQANGVNRDIKAKNDNKDEMENFVKWFTEREQLSGLKRLKMDIVSWFRGQKAALAAHIKDENQLLPQTKQLLKMLRESIAAHDENESLSVWWKQYGAPTNNPLLGGIMHDRELAAEKRKNEGIVDEEGCVFCGASGHTEDACPHKTGHIGRHLERGFLDRDPDTGVSLFYPWEAERGPAGSPDLEGIGLDDIDLRGKESMPDAFVGSTLLDGPPGGSHLRVHGYAQPVNALAEEKKRRQHLSKASVSMGRHGLGAWSRAGAGLGVISPSLSIASGASPGERTLASCEVAAGDCLHTHRSSLAIVQEAILDREAHQLELEELARSGSPGSARGSHIRRSRSRSRLTVGSPRSKSDSMFLPSIPLFSPGTPRSVLSAESSDYIRRRAVT